MALPMSKCSPEADPLIQGSDHCPVYGVMNEKVTVEGHEKNILDIVNPPGLFIDGIRQLSQVVPQPKFSIRMSSEYAGRQSIRDMFLKASARSLTPTYIPHAPGNGSQKPSSSPNTQDNAAASNPTEANNTKNSSFPATIRHDSTSKIGSLPVTVRTPPGPLEPSAKRQKKASPTKKLPDTARRKPPSCGQQSLMAFLKKPLPTPERLCSPPAERLLGDNEPSQQDLMSNESLRVDDEVLSQTRDVIVYQSREEGSFPSIDPIESKEKWSQLFAKPMAPRCEIHDEPCIQRITRKPGANVGRAFWMCPRLVFIL